ncbi:MAG: hypothetical protein ABSH13_23190, partial [Candidatus Acidiferrum sp.]
MISWTDGRERNGMGISSMVWSTSRPRVKAPAALRSSGQAFGGRYSGRISALGALVLFCVVGLGGVARAQEQAGGQRTARDGATGYRSTDSSDLVKENL